MHLLTHVGCILLGFGGGILFAAGYVAHKKHIVPCKVLRELDGNTRGVLVHVSRDNNYIMVITDNEDNDFSRYYDSIQSHCAKKESTREGSPQ